MKNRNSKDIFVVITSLIICIFALYAFWIFHNFTEVNNRVEVAWIHVLNGSCFIKRAESSKWIKAYNDYNLYLNVVPMPRQSENKKFKNKNGLMRFYKKFGFVHYTEDICVTTMFRKAYSLMAQQVSALD